MTKDRDEHAIMRQIESKRAFFDEGHTRPHEFRITQLSILRKLISDHEQTILEALHADLRKPRQEAYMSEIEFLYREIDHAIAHLRDWMRPREVLTPLALQPARSTIYYEPKGIVLVIGPWNYPFQLLVAPVVAAVAAGNCVVMKPSSETVHTTRVIARLFGAAFDDKFISVVLGPGSSIGPLLIENNRFDHIFFTGSPAIGREILAMAAPHLTPVTLELGGKSPAIVDTTVNVEEAARTLTWAKFFNAGQTCVCADYLLIHEDVKAAFVSEVLANVRRFFGDEPKTSPDYARIINVKRFQAVSRLLTGDIIAGGQTDIGDLYIAPTIIDHAGADHPAMQAEIFGPVLPILEWRIPEDVVAAVRRHRYPLACYIFSEDPEFVDQLIDRIEFGGGCVNNGIMHLLNPDLPFGGIALSGMGRYHGHDGFLTLSNQKSMLHSAIRPSQLRLFPPYPAAAAPLPDSRS